MRMRHNAYARPELEACPFFIGDPERWKGRWQKAFDQPRPLVLELGCGKGAYAAAMAALYFLVGRHMGFAAYMAAFLALTLAAAVLLYIWVRKKGCAIFASL